jgi:hypothetical protein
VRRELINFLNKVGTRIRNQPASASVGISALPERIPKRHTLNSGQLRRGADRTSASRFN